MSMSLRVQLSLSLSVWGRGVVGWRATSARSPHRAFDRLSNSFAALIGPTMAMVKALNKEVRIWTVFCKAGHDQSPLTALSILVGSASTPSPPLLQDDLAFVRLTTKRGQTIFACPELGFVLFALHDESASLGPP